MRTSAVILAEPGRIEVADVALAEPTADDVVVEIAATGISTGTEKLLWQGRMPAFPGLGYPLVPGYEAIGRVVEAGARSGRAIGETVFVPGSTGFLDVRGLFGAAAARLVVPGARTVASDIAAQREGLLLALAATAHHALGEASPDLIVGHGVLGRLLARLTIARGGAAPTVWENRAERRATTDYSVLGADDDSRRDYRTIVDASGDPAILDTLVQRLARGGEIVLAGFYAERLSFTFPPAFMREARLRVAAEWAPADMAAVVALIDSGALSLDGLISDTMPASDAAAAYERAFCAPDCLKMTLDWSH